MPVGLYQKVLKETEYCKAIYLKLFLNPENGFLIKDKRLMHKRKYFDLWNNSSQNTGCDLKY